MKLSKICEFVIMTVDSLDLL